jgi:hypothetical protein
MEAFVDCSNRDCEQHGRRHPTEIGQWGDVSASCNPCRSQGTIVIVHQEREFGSVREVQEIAAGYAREMKLMRRLVDAGIASPEERSRFATYQRFVAGIDCPGCGRPLLEHAEES